MDFSRKLIGWLAYLICKNGNGWLSIAGGGNREGGGPLLSIEVVERHG